MTAGQNCCIFSSSTAQQLVTTSCLVVTIGRCVWISAVGMYVCIDRSVLVSIYLSIRGYVRTKELFGRRRRDVIVDGDLRLGGWSFDFGLCFS